MSYLEESPRKRKAASSTIWSRIATFGLILLGICLITMPSVSFAQAMPSAKSVTKKPSKEPQSPPTLDRFKIEWAQLDQMEKESRAQLEKEIKDEEDKLKKKKGQLSLLEFNIVKSQEKKDITLAKQLITDKALTVLEIKEGMKNLATLKSDLKKKQSEFRIKQNSLRLNLMMIEKYAKKPKEANAGSFSRAPLVPTPAGSRTSPSFQPQQYRSNSPDTTASGRYDARTISSGSAYDRFSARYGVRPISEELQKFALELPVFQEQIRELQGGGLTEEKGIQANAIVKRLEELAIVKGLEELYKLKAEDPKAFELEKRVIGGDYKAKAFAKEIHEEKDPAVKKEKVVQLQAMLSELFTLRQQRRQLEAEAIAAELKKIQDFLQKREESKTEIIQRRLDQLTGDNTLDW